MSIRPSAASAMVFTIKNGCVFSSALIVVYWENYAVRIWETVRDLYALEVDGTCGIPAMIGAIQTLRSCPLAQSCACSCNRRCFHRIRPFRPFPKPGSTAQLRYGRIKFSSCCSTRRRLIRDCCGNAYMATFRFQC